LFSPRNILTIEHATDHQWPKGRDKDTMGNSPILLAGIVGCEKTIVDAVSDLM
jgi:hypothetical protein